MLPELQLNLHIDTRTQHKFNKVNPLKARNVGLVSNL